MSKPVIVARTFHLADYASDAEVLYYQPGDADELRRKIDLLQRDPTLRNQLAENSYRRLLGEFSQERYLTQLLQVCNDVCC